MAVEDYIAEATTEINAAKPINKNSNGEVIELSDAEYEAKITALATQKDEEVQNGWLKNRQAEYPSILDCIHALLDGGDTLTDLQAARQAVKDNNPKP